MRSIQEARPKATLPVKSIHVQSSKLQTKLAWQVDCVTAVWSSDAMGWQALCSYGLRG